MKNIFRSILIIAIYGSISMNTSAITEKDRVIYIKSGTVGSSSGTSYKIPLKESVESTTLYYQLQLSKNFDCTIRGGEKLTGKFPGLSGGKDPNTGGLIDTEDTNRGWSVRPIYRGYGCKLKLYLYDLNIASRHGKKSYGKDLNLNLKSFHLNPGEKYKIKLYVKMNDLEKENGIIKLWVNENLSAVYENIKFRNNQPNSGIIDEVRYSVFNGGGKDFKLEQDVSISIFDLHTE